MKSAQEISPHKLFDVLQKEYIVCILREKIFPIEKHKQFWNRLANQKKQKILDLKKKYGLISIFDNEHTLKFYEDIIYPEWGLPNFYYPNSKVKDQQIYWDTRNYFKIGSDVKFLDADFAEKKGIILYCDVKERLVTIKQDIEPIKISFDCVKRIF